MAGKKQLPPVRVVNDTDVPAPPKSLSGSFEAEDRVGELRAKRRILIAHMEHENTLARDLNGLMRQDNELSRQLDELLDDGQDELSVAASTVDEGFNPRAV